MFFLSVAVVIAFFVCWAPFHAQRLIASFNFDHSEDLKTAYFISTYVSGVLYYLSTCINPCIYHIYSLRFRNAFKACFTCSYSTSNNENFNNSRVLQQIWELWFVNHAVIIPLTVMGHKTWIINIIWVVLVHIKEHISQWKFQNKK